MSEEISAVQNGDSIDISEAERELIPSKGYIVDHITGEHVVTLLVGVRPPHSSHEHPSFPLHLIHRIKTTAAIDE